MSVKNPLAVGISGEWRGDWQWRNRCRQTDCSGGGRCRVGLRDSALRVVSDLHEWSLFC